MLVMEESSSKPIQNYSKPCFLSLSQPAAGASREGIRTQSPLFTSPWKQHILRKNSTFSLSPRPSFWPLDHFVICIITQNRYSIKPVSGPEFTEVCVDRVLSQSQNSWQTVTLFFMEYEILRLLLFQGPPFSRNPLR